MIHLTSIDIPLTVFTSNQEKFDEKEEERKLDLANYLPRFFPCRIGNFLT